MNLADQSSIMTGLLQLFSIFLIFTTKTEGTSNNPVVKVLTVATENNHGLERFLRSAKVYNINVEVLGQDKKWKGGDMKYPGGGQKINILKEKLTSMKIPTDRDQIILFTDRKFCHFVY